MRFKLKYERDNSGLKIFDCLVILTQSNLFKLTDWIWIGAGCNWKNLDVNILVLLPVRDHLQ